MRRGGGQLLSAQAGRLERVMVGAGDAPEAPQREFAPSGKNFLGHNNKAPPRYNGGAGFFIYTEWGTG